MAQCGQFFLGSRREECANRIGGGSDTVARVRPVGQGQGQRADRHLGGGGGLVGISKFGPSCKSYEYVKKTSTRHRLGSFADGAEGLVMSKVQLWATGAWKSHFEQHHQETHC